jgi:hypothetical protein
LRELKIKYIKCQLLLTTTFQVISKRRGNLI